MPVRGHRNPFPTKGGSPTGMFGQPQKRDPTDGYNKTLKAYAHSGGGEVRGKPQGSDKSKRHSPPKRRA